MLGLWPVRFRYTLRALFVFLTLFALWGGYHANRAWKERRAEALLLRSGASVSSRPAGTDRGLEVALLRTYEAAVSLLWRERFIREVQFYGEITPDVVGAIGRLPHLSMLWINAPLEGDEASFEMTPEIEKRLRRGLGRPERGPLKMTVPPGAIKEILSRHHLRDLALGDCILSARDMEAISQHRTLEALSVSGCNVSEDDLRAFLRLPNLHFFAFRDCQVRGTTLAGLPGNAKLTFIQCEGTPVEPEFAAFVARCPNLATLNTDTPAIDDNFLAALAAHPRLNALCLQKTRVTDECIDSLIRMPALKYVVLPNSGVTEQATARLLAARPGLRVVRAN